MTMKLLLFVSFMLLLLNPSVFSFTLNPSHSLSMGIVPLSIRWKNPKKNLLKKKYTDTRINFHDNGGVQKKAKRHMHKLGSSARLFNIVLSPNKNDLKVHLAASKDYVCKGSVTMARSAVIGGGGGFMRASVRSKSISSAIAICAKIIDRSVMKYKQKGIELRNRISRIRISDAYNHVNDNDNGGETNY